MKNANLVYRVGLGVVLVAGAAELAGCGQDKPPAVRLHEGLASRFPLRVGAANARVQVAALPTEVEHGLMGRTDLGADEGMIFVFDRPQGLSFWMKNTPTALDVGYFASDGTLEEIYPMYPRDERPVTSRSRRLHYALEMHLGWFAAHGVHTGDKLDLPALEAAIRARGFDPDRMGMPRRDVSP